ncbi:stage IV sporulation protein A [Symbiobacterium thermophilum]|uniref:Stage IV sporulation protein A n=1 Tax=Symbiobacterium thermophilum (strain DSM 24528 / JCM 14929 / IAM 14863 / T) TaxID=292459 RepID=Q67NS4_SYMTH|nr:stage IV sporulation protein A [Symbiobacterium thermophilum]BAD40669.1 stage IV sporulation protein A [Symbiobacterium thermophilum IAM 14863]
MERIDIFEDVARRTGGDIYIGVVGPVRTGKSTFIRRLAEQVILPNIEDEYLQARIRDELPQSGNGRTIMTVEPKFVPDEAVEITLREGLTVRVRLVDSVGYAVEGALGYMQEDGSPRMVRTPWFEEEIPFHDAAEIGTRKVIAEHSTIGLLVTTDGTITDLARGKYLEAEERVVSELQALGKPFVIVLNTTRPYAQETMELAGELEVKYNAPVIPVDASELTQDDIHLILEQALFEFPVREANIALPRWVEELDSAHPVRAQFEEAIAEALQGIQKIRDVDAAVERLSSYEFMAAVNLQSIDMGAGVAHVQTEARDDLYYQVLEEITGVPLEGKHTMVRLLREYTQAKREYDKIKDALEDVKATGYGVVTPAIEDITFEEPELVRQGIMYGVKLQATAPSLHFIRADISAEVTPIIGTAKQGEELVQYLLERFEDDPRQLWEFDIFGKSLHELVQEGIKAKLHRMPEDAQVKLQETLSRIINEGSGGLICIII